MPYRWDTARGKEKTLTLWPHQSLPPGGFVLFIGATSAMLVLPLLAVLGTVVLWALLPFLAIAVAGTWFAIHRNRMGARIQEELTLTQDHAHLVRNQPGREPLEWACNRYWAQPTLHKAGGPVPNYVTLRGNGREVEIGAFLSEDERMALFEELKRAL